MTSSSESGQEKSFKNGHDSATGEVFETWQNFYRQMTDEGMDFFQRGLETFQKMTPMYPGGELFKQWMENYQGFIAKVGEESTGGFTGDMDSYKRMYESWLNIWTSNLESYMRTPEFAARSGKDLEAFSELQKKSGEIMESYWSAIHLPSTHDMRELYQKLYTIERKLDEIDRRIRSCQTELQSSASAKKP